MQFFTPGIPQVYYVGLLAGGNDMDLLAQTGVGRDINRHRFTLDEIARDLERPVVAALVGLIRLRNTHPAFAGAFEVGGDGSRLTLRWRDGAHAAALDADFASARATLSWTGPDGEPHSCDDLLDLAGHGAAAR